LNLTGRDNKKVVKSFTSSPAVVCRGSPWITLSNTILKELPNVRRNVEGIKGDKALFSW